VTKGRQDRGHVGAIRRSVKKVLHIGCAGAFGWSQSELGKRAGLSLPTVKRLEGGFGPRVSDEARNKLQRALEAAGVEFIKENGGGPGVRLRNGGR
jgi:helix-turn-helix protein